MGKGKKKGKLRVKRETLAALDEEALRRANGGILYGGDSVTCQSKTDQCTNQSKLVRICTSSSGG